MVSKVKRKCGIEQRDGIVSMLIVLQLPIQKAQLCRHLWPAEGHKTIFSPPVCGSVVSNDSTASLSIQCVYVVHSTVRWELATSWCDQAGSTAGTFFTSVLADASWQFLELNGVKDGDIPKHHKLLVHFLPHLRPLFALQNTTHARFLDCFQFAFTVRSSYDRQHSIPSVSMPGKQCGD